MGATRPNLLFIMSDDHASHAISAYGSRINTTPHLDRLAEGGMRLDAAFCTNSICAPSEGPLEIHNLWGRPGTEQITAELRAELARLQMMVGDEPYPTDD